MSHSLVFSSRYKHRSHMYTHGVGSWEELGVNTQIADGLRCIGAVEPTAVQRAAVPEMLNGIDCVVHAPTGSGKTLAYLIPVLSTIDPDRQTTQAIVVVPTRELGLQVAAVTRRFATACTQSNKTRVTVMPLLAGSKLRRQRVWAWAAPPHIIVANAKQLEQMIRLGGLKKVPDLRILVIDEVDAFFDDDALSADRDALTAVIRDDTSTDSIDFTKGEKEALLKLKRPKQNSYSSKKRQTIFATATIEQPRYFVQSKLQDWSQGTIKYLTLGSSRSPPPTLTHFLASCIEPSKRLTAARRLLKRLHSTSVSAHGLTLPVLIFFDESRPLDQLARAFRVDGHRLALLSPDSDLDKRAKALSDFRSGKVDILLATDLAARGLDLPQVQSILNFDPPKNAVAYLHRAGRAGRCGNPGTVVTIIHDKERFAFERILNYCGLVDIPDLLSISPLRNLR